MVSLPTMTGIVLVTLIVSICVLFWKLTWGSLLSPARRQKIEADVNFKLGYIEGYNQQVEAAARAFGSILWLLERNQWAEAARIIRRKLEQEAPSHLPPKPHPHNRED